MHNALTNWRWPYVTLGFLGWMSLLTAMYYAHPSERIVWWTGIGLSGVAAIILGTVRNRPSHPLPWLLLAAANLSFTAGEVSEVVLTQLLHQGNPFPSVADGFYLATYPLYAAGLLIFIRRRSAGRDRGSLIDALTFTAALTLLSWIYIVLPNVHSAGLTWVQKAFAIAYPLGDILVLAMLLRLLVPHGPKSLALKLLTIGTVGMLVSDVLFGLIQLYGTWHIGTAVDLGWAAYYTLWGAAALHPSMVTMTRPVLRQPQSEVGRGRIGLLCFASMIAPGVLLLEAVRGNNRDAGVVGAFSALLFLLVLARLSGVVAAHRLTVARERALRSAVGALAAATGVHQVTSAIRSAAAALPPTHPQRQVLLGLSDDGQLRLPPGPSSTAAGPPFPRLPSAVRAFIATRRTQLRPVAELGTGFGEMLPGSADALLCPLALQDRPSGDPLIGVLIIGGEEEELVALLSPVESLASQAALALERITLSQEVNRRNSEAYFRTLVQNASDVILILDDDDRVRYASSSADQVLGYPSLLGAAIAELVPPEESASAVGALTQMRSRDHRDRREHWRMVRHDGVGIEVEVRASDLRRDPTVLGLVLTLRDVTEQRQLERELSHRAFHDSLTGLANRVLFQDRVNQAFLRGVRGGLAAGVLLIDLDDFKVVNDTMGHGVGDELLVAVSLRLSTIARASDTAARLGGDEFAVLIENSLGPSDVEAFANHVIKAFTDPFRLSTGPVNISVSVGISTTEDSEDAAELLAHADLAMYAAKGAGKRQWRRFHPVLQAGMIERHELQESLDAAVASTSFTVLYQPIVEISSGGLVGFEALLRWPHSSRGMVPPEQFIGLAEESGQIVPLGAWVLGHAAEEAARWQRAGHGSLYVSVNVSARQFRDPGFVDVVRQTLERYELDPGSLVLELTESVLMRRDDRIRADMLTLSELGVRLAIDDFGTGYSSLSYLREFPITILKIDKSFIDGLGKSTQQYALVEGITRIAETLGVRVIAEGIENTQQRDLLAMMGCPLGQGYLFSRPVASERAAALIRGGGDLAALPPRLG
ncbi:diguanylate cyclase (GGDEF)-like protein/PAS domain S-box-containing protein [Kitasatospora sp. MAP12-15]|uniref:putative bifunctional diguanylate cyclase/phosphodiesterase n=1 Tax=unclassified Kitasatospora TaxID=2633591 RepID=UPI002474FD06|nr:EAL domain-containing protein [Kitasatospora sp. MAP12-44]MDH6114952.1 diguanylate cyclase (GGDEF)-like protein/PAS domain S-box-containing protein [Kitasatospora sp. MAP12-44]